MNDLDFTVRSRGWDIIRDLEKETGETRSVDSIAKHAPIARATIRKFFDKKDADVSGMSIRSAQYVADQLGVSLCELLYAKPKQEKGSINGA